MVSMAHIQNNNICHSSWPWIKVTKKTLDQGLSWIVFRNMWVVGESLAERGVPMWFVIEQRRSFCGRSRWMVGWAALGGLPVSCRGESSGNFRPLSHGSQPSRVASILPTAEVSHSRQRENNRPTLTWPTRQKQPKKEYLQTKNLRDISIILTVPPQFLYQNEERLSAN